MGDTSTPYWEARARGEEASEEEPGRGAGAVHDVEAGIDLEKLLAEHIKIVLVDWTARVGDKKDALLVPLPHRLKDEHIHPHD